MEIAKMKPASTRATAKPASKGNSGAALGLLIVKTAEAEATAEEKKTESRKDTLRRLEKFTREDHLAFRAELDKCEREYKTLAEAAGFSLTAWRAMVPRCNSVIVTVSLWRKMSMAVETGLDVDYEQPWAYISQKATDAIASKAHTGTTDAPQTAAPTKRKGRPSKSNYDKAVALLDGMPLQDLEKIAAWLQKELQSKGGKAPK